MVLPRPALMTIDLGGARDRFAELVINLRSSGSICEARDQFPKLLINLRSDDDTRIH